MKKMVLLVLSAIFIFQSEAMDVRANHRVINKKMARHYLVSDKGLKAYVREVTPRATHRPRLCHGSFTHSCRLGLPLFALVCCATIVASEAYMDPNHMRMADEMRIHYEQAGLAFAAEQNQKARDVEVRELREKIAKLEEQLKQTKKTDL